MSKHRTKKVKLGSESFDIDAKLAPLVPLLWKCGIETDQCCEEEHPGLASIDFPSTADVERFLAVAQRPYKVELQTADHGEDGEHDVRVRLIVFFPAREVPDLVKAFKHVVPTET